MSNDLAAVAEVAILTAMAALRNNAVTPRLIRTDMDGAPAEQNATIRIPIFNNLSTSDVTPGVAPTNQDVKPRGVDIVLSQWKEVPFTLTEREMAEIMSGRIPEVLERATKALADTIDIFCLTKMVKRAGAGAFDVGAGAAASSLIQLRKLLLDQGVNRDLRVIHTTQTEAELLALTLFTDASQVGDAGTALREGSLGRKYGFDNFVNQNLLNGFTPGTVSAAQVNGPVTNAGGLRTIPIDTVTGTFKEGDVITIATCPGTYVVTADYSGAAGNLLIGPGLRIANTATLADNSAIALFTGWSAGTVIRSLAFHQDAFAFGSRPLMMNAPGVIMTSTTDPVTGLSMRLTVSYFRKALSWSLDMLYGGEVVEEERIAVAFT